MINNIARFIATADVPEDIQALGRPLIADCFGCMLAGATGEAATLIRTVQAGLSPGKVPLYGTDIGLTAQRRHWRMALPPMPGISMTGKSPAIPTRRR